MTVAKADRRRALPAARRSAIGIGSARRLDWRFLLPMADGRAVGVLRLVGGDHTLASQIEEIGLATRVLIGVEDSEPVDAVVGVGAGPEAIARAVGTLRPGGAFYWEVDRAELGVFRWSPSRLRRLLAQSGLVTVAYWRRRRESLDTLFLPLDVPGAFPWYLRESLDGRNVLRRLARRGLLVVIGRTAADSPSSLAATRSPAWSSRRGRRWMCTSLHRGCWQTDIGELVLPAVIAGGEGPWSRVVLLPFGRCDEQPRAVLKLPRSREHNWATEREQSSLAQVRGLLPSQLAATVPAPLGVRTWSGLTVGTECFLPGRPLAFAAPSARGRSSASAQLAGAVGWLIELHLATRVYDLDADDPSALEILIAPLRRVILLLGLPVAADADSLRERYGSLRGLTFPMVWQHCDLTPVNIRWDGRRHSVVDWEAARTGPALCDLFYLLLQWEWEDVPALDTAPGEVLRRVFLSRGGAALIASAQVRRYCAALGVDHRLMEPLLLCMLSQQALDRADRVRDSGGDPAEDDNLYGELISLVLGAKRSVPAWELP